MDEFGLVWLSLIWFDEVDFHELVNNTNASFQAFKAASTMEQKFSFPNIRAALNTLNHTLENIQEICWDVSEVTTEQEYKNKTFGDAGLLLNIGKAIGKYLSGTKQHLRLVKYKKIFYSIVCVLPKAKRTEMIHLFEQLIFCYSLRGVRRDDTWHL